MLKVTNLVKEYQIDSTKIRALDGVSFDLKDGEILGVIGRSGGGKSSLMKVLRGFEPFNEGAIEIDGLTITPDATNEDIRKLQSITAIHLQRNFALWPGPAIENIIRRLNVAKAGHEALPAKDSPFYDELEAESMKYMEIVGLAHKAQHFSAVLSGGEKQRLLIARQIAAKPKLMLLDEPATMTCPATKQEILDTIKAVNEKLKIKIILVSHLPEIHDYLAHRVLWLEGGKIVGEGSPDEILRKFLKGIDAPQPLPKRKSRKAEIKVKDFSKRYWLFRQGEVLDIVDMNVSFRHGEIAALIGPSGAGKTTLLHALDGLVFPDGGEITYMHDGNWVDISTYSPARMELRRRMAIMYQEFALSPHSTVKEQIAWRLGVKGQSVIEDARAKAAELGIPDMVLDKLYQLTDTPDDDAKDTLAKLGFTPAILRTLFPSSPVAEVKKYAEPVFKAVDLPLSVLDAKPYQLSGGENVRAALALAFASKPDILLLDEPFGDLDPITLRSVANAIKNIVNTFGTTIVLVSHHMDFVKEVAHRAILIENGTITNDGKPEEVVRDYISRTNAKYLRKSLEDYLK